MTGSINQNTDYNDYLIRQQQQQQLQDQGLEKSDEKAVKEAVPKIVTKLGDAIETSSTALSSTVIPLASFSTPELPAKMNSIISNQTSDNPSPSKYEDLVNSAKQIVSILPPNASKTGNGLTMLEFLNSISEAIKQAEEALKRAEQQMIESQKKMHAALDPNSGVKRELDYAAGAERVVQAKMVEETQKAIAKGGDVESALRAAFKDVTLSPRMEKLMIVLGQLENLQRNATANVTGGVILANTPKVVYELQELGIQFPSNAGPFAGIGARMAKKGKPPYDNPDYANMAKTLPKGWEVISKTDLNNLILNIGQLIKEEAGSNFGIMQKPLQELFGYTLFANPPSVPEFIKKASKEIGELQKILDYAHKKNIKNYPLNVLQPDWYLNAIALNVAPPSWKKSIASGFLVNASIPVSEIEATLTKLVNAYKAQGGDSALHPKPPTDPGQGLMTTGAVGDISSSLASSLNALFGAELNTNFYESGLTPMQSQNVRQISSLAVTTTSLSVGSKSAEKADASANLSSTIQALKTSSSAFSIVNSVMGRSAENKAGESYSNLSDFQMNVMGSMTQAFMTNLSAAALTSPSGTVRSDNISPALNALQNNPEVGDAAASALAFLNADSSKLDDPAQLKALVQKVIQDRNAKGLTQGQLDQIEELQKMIKMLKKILEELLSGGFSSQQLGSAIKEISSNMGNDQAQNTISHNSV